MYDHFIEFGLGNLVVVDDLLGLEIENSKVLVLSNGVHEVLLGVDERACDFTLVDFVFSELSVLHRLLDIDLDRDH